MIGRLPAHIEISGLIRSVESMGGSAMVLHKGERDAGSIVVITINADGTSELFERMPQLDGSRNFVSTKSETSEKQRQFDDYIRRRCEQDPDVWAIEVNIADPERFTATLLQVRRD